MTQTLEQVTDTLKILLSDPKDQKWPVAQKYHFLNRALTDIVSSERIPYIRVAELPIRDAEYEYEFPADMLEPVAFMIQNIEGSLIVSTSWRSILGSVESGNTLVPQDDSIFYQTYNRASGYVTLRDIVSDNKFIFSPYYDADLQGSIVTKTVTLPSSASVDQIWVDTLGEENLVYKCTTGYNAVADQASVTIGSDLLAGSTDLVFTYDITDVQYVQIVLNDAGPTGVSSVSVTGDASDRSNPLTYTYTLYQDNNSNDNIIALAPADMTVTGSDATAGAFTATSAELTNPSETNWEQQVIHLRYAAVFPKLSNGEDELPAELPVLIRESDCLAYIAASKMLMTVKGDERLLIMAREFHKEYRNILERVHQHRMNNGPPYDLEPN